jgi:hypothetical protein
VLLVPGQPEQLNRIVIGERSKVAGAILVSGQGLASEKMQELVIEKDASVKGLLYCDGILELYGNVNGSVITSSFLYKSASTRYSNLLKDVQVSELDYPELFFGIELPNLGNGAPLIVKKV